MSVDENRMYMVDYIQPYHTCPITFVMKAPTFLNNSMILWDIFKESLWIGLILFLFLVSIFAKLMNVKNYFFINLCPILKQGKIFVLLDKWLNILANKLLLININLLVMSQYTTLTTANKMMPNILTITRITIFSRS